MKKEISPALKWGNRISLLLILLAIALLLYMIPVEGEPGALPLLLLLSGTVWFLINRYRIRKQLK